METIQEEKRIALEEDKESISFLKEVVEGAEAERARPSQHSARPSGAPRPERLYSHD